MKGSAGGVKDAENNGLVGTIEEDLDKLLLVIENVEKSLTLRKNSLSSYSNINEKNGNRFLEDAECNTDDANKTVNQNRSNSNFQPLTKFKERQPNVLSQCSMQLRNEDVLDGNDFRQYFEFPPKMVSLPNSNIWFMNKTVDYDHNKPPIPPKTSYSSNQQDIGVVSPDKASPKTVSDFNSSFSPILLRSSLVKTKTAGMCGAYKYSDCELDLDDGLVCQDKMTNGFTRSGVYKDNKTFQVDLNPARNKSAETIQFTSSQNTVPDTNIIPESSSAINIAVPTLKNMDISRKSSKPGRFPTNAVSLSVSSSKDTIQPKHDYNKINSTGPYDNLLPGKVDVKLKPVSPRLTSQKSAIAIATQQLRLKHQELLALRRGKTKSRSSSAPSSPTMPRKLLVGGQLSKDRRGRLTTRSSARLRDTSTSSLRARSPSPSKSEIVGSSRHLRCHSSSALPSINGHLKKTLSVTSLRSRRQGSNLSLCSLDSESIEDDLKEIHEDARRERKKDEREAAADKERLQCILDMCAEFMDTTMKKDKESEKLSKDENASPAAASKMPCNYRRLESFEGDIWKQPLPVMNAYSGPIDASTDDLTQRTIRACEDADRTLQADDNIMFAKSVRKIPTADVAEIQRLREQGLSRIEAVQRRICELEVQLSESTSELDMERALIAGELSSEKTNLVADERSCDELKDQIISLEEEYIAHREKHQGIVDKEKRKLQQIQKKVSETRKQMDKCPESMRGSIEATLQKEQEELEQESRRFEDAEFNSLETMSRLDEEKEVMQRTLIRRKRKLEMQIDNRKGRVASLQQQLDDITAQQTQENQRLNNERDEAIGSLQEQREETTLLERKYYQLTGEFPPSVDTPVSLARSHRRMSSTTSSRSDVFKRQISCSSSKVDTTKIFNFSSSTDLLSNASKSRPLSGDKSMGYNEFATKLTDDSILSFRPRSTNLATSSKNSSHYSTFRKTYKKDRSSPISTINNDHLMALQQQIRDGQTSLSPVTTSLLSSRQKLNSSASPIYQRLNSTNGQSRATSADKWKDTTSISSMDSLDTTLSTWSIQSPESHDIEKLLEMEQLIADATAEKKRLLAEVKGQKLPTNTSPTSPSHEEMSQVKLRSSNGDRRQARPMTRYLPVRASDFNLRHHIESCGHNPAACRHLSINATSCRGYMTKMGGRIKTWRKRWFVFDRISKTLSYYSDKHEIKLKGMIYFHAMEDVFFDHLKGHKSPNPSLTFCVKCFDRIYYLVAPSCESMRIWMDTLVTGSEGYREYMKTFE